MNRKVLVWLLTAVVIGAGVGVGIYIWKNFRGAGPALTKPSTNIAEVIENTPVNQQQPPAQPVIQPAPSTPSADTTDFPLKMPQGFSISVFAKNIPGARVMTYDNTGRILVSSPGTGRVYAINPAPEGTEATVTTAIEGLNRPHGLAMRCLPDPNDCKLYVAEENQLSEFVAGADGKFTYKKKLADLPSGGRHTTRTLLFMPFPDEDKLLISIGSACDVCVEADGRRGTVQVYNFATGQIGEFADGLRNTVFMSIHPVNGQIWGTDMGRDFLGDNLPPDEINIIEQGRNYGWPYCYGKNVHDNKFDPSNKVKCEEGATYGSHIDIPAHSAPLGIAFVPEEGWPEDYWYNALVSYHGSWNRSTPTGYKIVRYKLDANGNYLGEEDFLSGWLQSNNALGRPVDILIQPGGTIFVSDDKADLVYRIKYQP